jgi:hypothetical protein
MLSNTAITLVRCLTKLKTLDKQIQGLIQKTVFVSIEGELRPVQENVKKALSSYQKINDLIEYRRKLKSAIIISNATTQVIICGRKMTVAEAIEEKQSIKHKKTLQSSLKQQYAKYLREVENHNTKIRSNLERETSYQSDTKKTETSEEYQRGYMKLHKIKLFDPLNIVKQIDLLDEYIREFECEVDHVLSESNAITKIIVA